MPIKVVDQGARNRIFIDDHVQKGGTGVITISGDDNELFIGPMTAIYDLRVNLGSQCRVFIEGGGRIAAVEVLGHFGAEFRIGKGTGFTWGARLYAHEAGKILIGRNCLIAGQVLFTVSDMHSIQSLDTGERLNPAADIVLEDQIWLATDVKVLKGVRIGSGSVVATGSIITRDVPQNCLAAGVPARVVRERIKWTPELL